MNTLLWPAYTSREHCRATPLHYVAQFTFRVLFPFKMHETFLPVSGESYRCCIAECFQLLHVIVKGPKGCLCLVGFTYVVEPISCPNFRLCEMLLHGTSGGPALIITQNASFHARLRLFRVEMTFPKLGSCPKNWNFWRRNRTCKLSATKI